MFFKKLNAQEIENQFAGYDSENQLRPKINKGDFFRMTGFDLGWLLLEPINIAESREKEPELAKRFSSGQKALYFWWYLDGQVTNGGFVQFYYNGYNIYVPAIIEGLEHIGDKEMVKLVKAANKIYLDNRKLMDKARKKDLFESDLYDRLDELSDLDDKYYEINAQTMSLIEKYARQHPNEFCVDENGQPFDRDYTGKCTTTFDNGKIKEEFDLTNGVINGEFKAYYETGQIKSVNTYVSGEQVGEQKEWYENGNLKRTITIDPNTKERKKEYYYDNGQISKLEHTDVNNESKGEYKEWYENGELKEQAIFISNTERIGAWLKFYEDGSKKLEAEFKDGDVLFHNYWNEKGEQLLKDGTGLYINEWVSFGKTTIYETEYKEYKRHGKSRTIREGKLTLEQEFQNGKEHGITRSFYNNGTIEEETLYENGVKISEKKFDKFEEAVVITVIECEMTDEMLTNRDLQTADTYPKPKNAAELANSFLVDLSFFDGYPQDYELGYTYFVSVDKNGNVTNLDFLVADNGRIADKVESNIKKIEFEPATKSGQAVDSYVIVKHKFKLGQKN